MWRGLFGDSGVRTFVPGQQAGRGVCFGRESNRRRDTHWRGQKGTAEGLCAVFGFSGVSRPCGGGRLDLQGLQSGKSVLRCRKLCVEMCFCPCGFRGRKRVPGDCDRGWKKKGADLPSLPALRHLPPVHAGILRSRKLPDHLRESERRKGYFFVERIVADELRPGTAGNLMSFGPSRLEP